MGVNFSHSSHKTPEKPLKGIWASEVYSLGGYSLSWWRRCGSWRLSQPITLYLQSGSRKINTNVQLVFLIFKCSPRP